MNNLERALGRVAASNADYGAFVSLTALKEALREHGEDTAADLLDEIGERVIMAAFHDASWNEDSVSEQQPEAIAEKARRPGGQHGMG